MAGRTARIDGPASAVVVVRALKIATAALLLIDAYVHFDAASVFEVGTGMRAHCSAPRRASPSSWRSPCW